MYLGYHSYNLRLLIDGQRDDARTPELERG